MIPHNKPTMGKEESAAMTEVLASGWVAEGAKVKEFEDAVCAYLGLSKGSAVAVSNGTSALYLALLALNVKGGDEIIVPSYVCSAVLNAVYMAGATPVLVDINADDLNISFSEVKERINKKTKAIITTHTFGMPADVSRFTALRIPVIEDCAQAIGAKIHGRFVGTQGKVSIFSFYATKMLTTGNGGMIVSRDRSVIRRALDYREFDGRTRYTPRFNFQMSDIQAAMGIVQLRRLPSFIQRRIAIARLYSKLLPPELELWPARADNARGLVEPNFYRILLRTKHAKDLKHFLEKQGIKTIIPIERFELLHRYLRKNPKQFPICETAARTTLSLPAHASLSDSDVRKISAAVREYWETL